MVGDNNKSQNALASFSWENMRLKETYDSLSQAGSQDLLIVGELVYETCKLDGSKVFVYLSIQPCVVDQTRIEALQRWSLILPTTTCNFCSQDGI